MQRVWKWQKINIWEWNAYKVFVPNVICSDKLKCIFQLIEKTLNFYWMIIRGSALEFLYQNYFLFHLEYFHLIFTSSTALLEWNITSFYNTSITYIGWHGTDHLCGLNFHFIKVENGMLNCFPNYVARKLPRKFIYFETSSRYWHSFKL